VDREEEDKGGERAGVVTVGCHETFRIFNKELVLPFKRIIQNRDKKYKSGIHKR